jgi:transposase-like protein
LSKISGTMKTSEKSKDAKQLATPSSFCWNEECADYGRANAGNLRKFGLTRKGRQRWQCITCKKVVAETRGTVFHGKHHSEGTILECLAMLADRNSLAAIQRVKGVKEETVTAWLMQVAPQMEQIEDLLLKDHKLKRAQLDALWTYVGHKGEKKDVRKKTSAAHFGAGRPSKPRPGCESGEPSPRPKKKSPQS